MNKKIDKKTYKILVADDELELIDPLRLFFEKEGLELIEAEDGLKCLELFKKEQVHLLILDIMMPGMDGFEVLRQVRKKSKVPAIMVTARTADYDKILGLELGADDYITKPYNPMEVLARVKAQLRRCYDYGELEDKEEIKVGNLSLNILEALLKKDKTAIELTKTEFLILELFMKNPGRIFTKQQIFDYVWDEPYLGDDNTILVHISNLRSKIEDDPKKPTKIKTIKGLGYKLEKN